MSRRCDLPIVGFDTEDAGTGPDGIYSAQLVGEDGREEFLERERDEDAFDFRLRVHDALRARGAVDVWACNMAYDAGNVGLVSRGVTADKSSRGYTSLRHDALPGATFYNTGALVDAGVAELGAAIGLPKFEVEQFERGVRDPVYAMRDAEIVCRYMVEFRRGLEELAPGVIMRPTAGATASALWRAMGGRVAPLPKELRAAARTAYRGGRVEVFRFAPSGTVEVWDMRSAFPHAMIQGGFPAGDWRATRDIRPHGLYEVDVEVSGPIGALPVRCDGTNVYPVGRFRGLYFGEELTLPGVQVRRVLAGWCADETVDPFVAYVDKLWAQRHAQVDEHGRTPAPALAAKTLLNALYGVVGHGGSIGGLATVGKGCRLEGLEVAPDVIDWSLEREPGPGSNAAWSALITARVRARLYRAMLEQVGRLVYVDTDSLFLLGGMEGYAPPTPHGEELGDWRLDSRATEVQMIAPKVYALRYLHGWKFAAKGIRKVREPGAKTSPAEDFIRHGRARWRAPLTVLEAAWRAQGEEAGEWVEVERAVQRSYRARRVLPDGTTEPWDAGRLFGLCGAAGDW